MARPLMALALLGACSTNDTPSSAGGTAGTGSAIAGASGSGTTTGSAGASGAAISGAGAGPSGAGGANVAGASFGASSGASGTSGASGASSTNAGGAAGTAGSGGAPIACQPAAPVAGTAVVVNVNLATTRATVAPEMMGLHTSAYDNYLGSTTTPGLLKAAGVRSLRFPGGSYADAYHWSNHTMTGDGYLAQGAHFGGFLALLDSIGAAGAMITVNYGSNIQGTGPGVPQEAAAWVAYANGSAQSTTSIGLDETGKDWKTVGYWASLRAAAKLAVDDGLNFLRIARPTPVGIKYWELGNELYGNGFYYGGEGWEEDLHLPHDGTARQNNAKLSPVMYGSVFPSFATAMKAVDPSIQVGAVLHWPYTEYTSPDWNDSVLSSATCAAMDFGVNHWYAGTSFTDLLTRGRTDIPKMFSDLAAKVKTRCPSKAGTLPLAVTEWGPNYLNFMLTPPANTQLVGLFAADSYANFMEQGAIHVDWLELHNASYLGEAATDATKWGYKGQQMAGYLANAGDSMVQATLDAPPAPFAGGLLQVHAAKRSDGSVGVMLVNTSPSAVAAATITISGLSGGNLPCVGTRYVYAPANGTEDGQVGAAPIFSSNDASNKVGVDVPAYSVVVLSFPKPS